jgi:hypothetical protein
MNRPGCRRQPLSLGRRILCDFTHFSLRKHTASAERTMRLADVVTARRAASPRPSWAAIMTRAFAIAARNHPEMRRVFLGFPWGHLGEYDSQIASVVMTRRVGDEDVLFLAPLAAPESQSLEALDAHLRRYSTAPVAEVRAFRESLRAARLPRLVRRFLWWLAMNLLPGHRARTFGTFGVTTMSPYGARTVETPSLWTAFLHYGVMSEAGEVPVGLVFDHRVMDGSVVGYTLLEMEQVLRHEITAELRSMRAAGAA